MMIDRKQRLSLALQLAIVLASIVVGVILTINADRDFLNVELPPDAPVVAKGWRPAWLMSLQHPSARIWHDFFPITIAATLASGGLVVCDRKTWTRRGRVRQGTVIAIVSLLIVALVIATQLLATSAPRPFRFSYQLLNALDFRVPGAVLGIWVVGWLGGLRRSNEWRERFARFVGWVWMIDAAYLVGSGILFG